MKKVKQNISAGKLDLAAIDAAHAPAAVAEPTAEELARRAAPGEFKTVPRSQVRPSEMNPRKVFPQAALEELAETMKGGRGILQALLVRARPPRFTIHAPDLTLNQWTLIDAAGIQHPFNSEEQARAMAGEGGLEAYYEIIAGERRWRAAEIAGLKDVPVIIRHISDADALEMMLIENCQREGLTPLEEGESYREILDSGRYTAATLAEKLGIKRSTVFARMALMKMSPLVRKVLTEGKIDASLAAVVAKAPGEKGQAKFLETVLAGGEYNQAEGRREPMSVRAAQYHLEQEYMIKLGQAKWELGDALLLPEAGSCAQCPKRTGNAPDEFPMVKSPDVCTDAECFRRKQKARENKLLTKAEEGGKTVLTAKETKSLFQWGQVRDSAPFIAADEVMHDDQEKRTMRQLLKGAGVKLAVAFNPDGKLVELFPKKEAQLVLAENHNWAKKAAEKNKPQTVAEKAAEDRKHVIAQAQEWAVLDALTGKIGKTPWVEKLERKFWVNLATCLIKSKRDLVQKLAEQGRDLDPKDLGKLEIPELKAIAVALVVLENRYYYAAGRLPKSDVFDLAVELWEIDEKKVKGAAKEAFEAKEVEDAKAKQPELDANGSDKGKVTAAAKKRFTKGKK